MMRFAAARAPDERVIVNPRAGDATGTGINGFHLVLIFRTRLGARLDRFCQHDRRRELLVILVGAQRDVLREIVHHRRLRFLKKTVLNLES